ncbi:hypothetical protein CfE428DRAFT_1832 [Chthoniobacter flavus Ellin428]|uniref:Uncharacterized protein n=2 Tax=Chthoniobacter flavus TaxID=191863 RepID=B4CYU4_9BACT|nr:hypothetical protein CfE428DRAFT_1832 [Chthoniobacter flavus Ellin428]TCO89858.1 hypothetical protein EV701_11230 [Chthoniobacter flavus]
MEQRDFGGKSIPLLVMIHTRERLAVFIGDVLHRQNTCRVFSHVLFSCWPVPPEKLPEEIASFAVVHGWEVRVHEPAAYGVVADFQRAQTKKNSEGAED